MTLLPVYCPTKRAQHVSLNDLRIRQAEGAKYLALHLDRRLNWRKDDGRKENIHQAKII